MASVATHAANGNSSIYMRILTVFIFMDFVESQIFSRFKVFIATASDFMLKSAKNDKNRQISTKILCNRQNTFVQNCCIMSEFVV